MTPQFSPSTAYLGCTAAIVALISSSACAPAAAYAPAGIAVGGQASQQPAGWRPPKGWYPNADLINKAASVNLHKVRRVRFDFDQSWNALRHRRELAVTGRREIAAIREALLHTCTKNPNAPKAGFYAGATDRIIFDVAGERSVQFDLLPDSVSWAGPFVEKMYWHYWKQEFKGLSPEDYLANRIPERLRRKSDPRIYARLEAAVARWQKKTAEMYAELAKNPGDSVLRVKFLRANNGLANLENTLDVSVDERLTLAARTYRRTLAVDPSNGEALDMMKHIEAYFRRKNKPVPR